MTAPSCGRALDGWRKSEFWITTGIATITERQVPLNRMRVRIELSGILPMRSFERGVSAADPAAACNPPALGGGPFS
jgi:hypothetical protein